MSNLDKLDKLDEMFSRQREFGKLVGLDYTAIDAMIVEAVRSGDDVHRIVGMWLLDYISCTSSELEELKNCVNWKHWTTESKSGKRYTIHNLQNARVEIIDILHFFINMAMCLGLTSDDVYELFIKKSDVNFKRQESGYSMHDKSEDDNKNIRLE